ncbi:GvpL/GvpF family gas vesicle protein [Marinactinospora thermotolerans]|uniref:Gas vesicle synthesis protein GvpL/GvpF n=1 Tax=Marinactinospora thermotolerans DSM 45154 TaxID=1122192 RepID=A0A1T4P2Q4_9ACTN|nr:GvpL/GvpF family gas vesicle protein [Marinactinospora thermotolerans]SJZ85546.1 Gas vesicle synthesis protein GvpL/GvpF [Marinactinospora thermotolerans DSM 45154]
MSTYVYGIVRSSHPLRLDGRAGVGDPAPPVRRIEAGDLVAVVSDAPEGLRAKRRDLTAHQEVLDLLGEQGAVLPMRFGTVAPDDGAVTEELTRAAAYYEDLLARLDGRTEVNVKAFHNEDAALREVLREDAGLRSANEALRAAGGGTPAERVAFGERVALVLDEHRRRDADRVVEKLRPHAEEIALGPQVDGCVANVSLLVERSRMAEVEQAVQELRSSLGWLMDIRMHGPLPPYSFVAAREEAVH